MTKPLVSVCIVTYQHARFIAQAVEGALRQKTDFPVEILIGEDESTDGTRDLCLAFARQNPKRVWVFLRSRRDVVQIDGRPRGSFNFRMTLREARGEFVALCEGDDYWTDPGKLQRQVDYLRANPDCVGCFHDVKLVDANGRTLQKSYFQSDQDKFTREDVLATLLSRQPTCSLVFRRSAFCEPLPEWYLRRPCDFYLDILLAAQGSLGFVRRNMGAYRKHAGGIWSGQREANQIVELIIRYKLLLADQSFQEQYGPLLLGKIDELQNSLFARGDVVTEVGRLEKITHQQAAFISVVEKERDRFANEAKLTSSQATRAARESQKHIGQLRDQLGQLADTSRQQEKYILTLKKEHERLAREGRQARADFDRLLGEAQGHTASLKKQLDALGATARQQAAYVSVLEKERDRLAAEKRQAGEDHTRLLGEAHAHLDTLKRQLDALAETSRQQAAFILTLEKERKRLAAEKRQAGADHTRQLGEAHGHLETLRRQLDALAETSRQQAAFILTLEKECKRLAAEKRQAGEDHTRLLGETHGHLDTLKRQLDALAETSRQQAAFILNLEKERDRLAAENRQAGKDHTRLLGETHGHLDTLKRQLDALAETSRQQGVYIATLEKERDRLAGTGAKLAADSAHYVEVINQQAAYIVLLEQQRSQGDPSQRT